MGKILLFLFTIQSFFALALSDFELDLSSNHQLLLNSVNYKSIHTNDDQTVSIVEPKFSNPLGDDNSLPISNDSNLNGLCKLYGFGTYIVNSMKSYYAKDNGRNVIISSEGKFSGFTKQSKDNAIESFSCNTGNKQEISVNYAKISTNDDGTKTILKPLFKINGVDHFISNDSNLNGLCKLYGQANYILNSMLDFDPSVRGRNVVVTSKSKFKEFTNSREDNAIHSFMCE
jgi:hypothetical protein